MNGLMIYAAGFVAALFICGWSWEVLVKQGNPFGLALFAAAIWPIIAVIAAGELARKAWRRITGEAN